MKLPDNSIGISDINAWRDCPQRMAFGMQRWEEEGEAPEAEGPNTAYGSAIHFAIEYVERELATNDEAIQAAFSEYGKWLDPGDLERMKKDMDTYRTRDREFAGFRAVAVEDDFRVPMFEHNGETIYFRFKLDRVYQSVSDPTHFVHVDYKSSKWKKNQQEVHEDPQMWSYNFGIHEIFPECESLQQFYDQLLYGMVPTRKSAAQREQIKEWLIKQMRAILGDEEMEPKFNMWCPWCALLESCPEPRRTAEFARARIAALAPEDQDTGKLDVDPDLIEVYISEAENAKTIIKALEKFIASINGVVRDMPTAVRTYHGYDIGAKELNVWTPSGLREAHRILGDDFYTVVKLGKTTLDETLKGDDRRGEILDLALKESQNPSVRKLKGTK
jgi:hypothetical protein